MHWSVRILTAMATDRIKWHWRSPASQMSNSRCYGNKDMLSVCRIILLQRKPDGPHQTFDLAECGPRVGHCWPSRCMSSVKKATSITFASLQACQHARNFGIFSYTVVCIYSFYYVYVGWKQSTLIELSENTQSTELYVLKTKNVSFFEDTKTGPIIMTLLLLNHRIDFRCD